MKPATGSLLLTLLTLSAFCGGDAFAHGGSHGHHGGGRTVHTATHANGFPTHASHLPAVSPVHVYCKSTGSYVQNARDCPGQAAEEPAENAARPIEYNGR